jgi:hypothetical protein
MTETDAMREKLIQDRSSQILDLALLELRAQEGPDAVIRVDMFFIAKLLARISAQQEMMLKELRGIHGHVGTM